MTRRQKMKPMRGEGRLMQIAAIRRSVTLLTVGLAALAAVPPAFAGAGSLLDDVVKGGAKQLMRKIPGEVLEPAGRNALEEAAEVLVRRTGSAVTRQEAARLIRELSEPGLRTLMNLPEDLVSRVAREVTSDPKAYDQLMARYGAEVFEAVGRHPGVGRKLVETWGRDGLEIALKHSTDDVNRLMRYADTVRRLPAPDQAEFLRRARGSIRDALDWLEQHPNLLKYGTVGAVAAYGVHAMGRAQEVYTAPDGSRRVRSGVAAVTGVLGDKVGEGMSAAARAAGETLEPLGFVAGWGLAGLALLWVLIRARRLWREEQQQAATRAAAGTPRRNPADAPGETRTRPDPPRHTPEGSGPDGPHGPHPDPNPHIPFHGNLPPFWNDPDFQQFLWAAYQQWNLRKQRR